MADVVFDGANSISSVAGVTNLTTPAWTVSGGNRILIGAMNWGANPAQTYVTMKWDGAAGTALTQLGSTLAVDSFRNVSMAALVAPATGSRALYGEVSGVCDELIVGGASYVNAKQVLPSVVTATAAAQTGPATASVNVASANGRRVVAASLAKGVATDGMAVAVGADQTQRWEHENLTSWIASTMSDEPGAGTVTMSEVYTSGGSTISWGIIATSIEGTKVEIAERIFILP